MTEDERRAPAGGRASAGGHLELGRGAEFDLIRGFLARWTDAGRGIGSDCATVEVPPDSKLLLSVDTSVEDVHFRRAWLTPTEIGYRATAAALSDLAAAGASPLAILLAVSAPPMWVPDLPAVADGVGQSARDAGTVVVGGDTTSGPALVLTVTVVGAAQRPLTRSGARPGDRVYLSGTFGGPGAALRAWARHATPDAATRARFARPVPRLREGRWLAAEGVTAAVDVSDGIMADLGHLAAASGVRLSIDLDRVPRWPGTTVIEAAASGEEYELAVTAARPLDVAAFAREFGIPLTHVGDVESGSPVVEARAGGARVAPIAGYDHLSASPDLGRERRDTEPR
jgi:thiamine-monophosphate kinase